MKNTPSEPESHSSGITRELAGHVWVDSGRLIVVDPTYLDQLAEQEDQILDAERQRVEVLGEGMGIAFRTGPRTGRYPVYVTRFENGSVAKVEIEIDARVSN